MFLTEYSFTSTKSVDPDKIPHYHLCLHSLSNLPVWGFQYTKGLMAPCLKDQLDFLVDISIYS